MPGEEGATTGAEGTTAGAFSTAVAAGSPPEESKRHVPAPQYKKATTEERKDLLEKAEHKAAHSQIEEGRSRLDGSVCLDGLRRNCSATKFPSPKPKSFAFERFGGSFWEMFGHVRG